MIITECGGVGKKQERVVVLNAYRLIEMVAHRVGQGPDGVVQDEEILVLVLPEGKHQRVQDEAQVGNQLCARLLLQSSKRTKWGWQCTSKDARVKSAATSCTLTPTCVNGGSDINKGTKCIIVNQ